MESIAPLSLQEDWDNSGFQLKLSDNVNRVLVALEITDEVIDEAIEMGADLILTHHPLYFRPLKCIESGKYLSDFTIKLIKNNISVYSSHTPFDICEGGNNDYLGQLLGLENIRPMAGDDSSITRCGTLKVPATAYEIIEKAEEALVIDSGFFKYSGELDTVIRKIGWCTGAGDEFVEMALKEGCELFISGDVKYHTAQNARSMGISLLDCGHFGTEYLFAENMASKLDKSENLDILVSRVNINPFTLIQGVSYEEE